MSRENQKKSDDHGSILTILLDKLAGVWYNNARKRSLALARRQVLMHNNSITGEEKPH